jgi:hypothetical protein
MNGDDPGSTFYKGLSYLGRPVSVGLTGESPLGTPASGASATPSGGIGATGPAKGTGGVTGPTGAPSALQQALTALGLTSKGTSALKRATGSGPAPGEAAAPEVPAAANLPPGTELPGGAAEIGHEVIPAAQPLPVAQPVAETIESVGAETAPAQGAGAAGAAGAAETVAEGATPTPALLIPLVLAALEAAGVQMPKPITAAKQFGPVGEFSSGVSFASDPSLKTGLNLAESFATFGLSDVAKSFFGGKPPAMSFPANTWSQIHSQVAGALPPKLPVPDTATPEQQKAITDVNSTIDGLLARWPAEIPAWVRRGGPQSAESWGNIMKQMKSEIEGEFANLSTLYQKAMQATQAPPPAPPSPTTSSSFFRGTEKLPQQ